MVVSSALFVAAAVLISGRQNQTAFDQSIRHIQGEIQQSLNDVAVGYFPDTSFRCSGTVLGPTLSSAGSTGQGTNNGCIFLGKAMQFKVSGTSSPEEYAIYSLAGLQQTSGKEVGTLAEALPKAVAPSTAEPGNPDISVNGKLQNGLTVSRMWYNNGGPNVDIGAIAFTSSLSSYDVGGGIKAGAQQVVVYPVAGSALNTTKRQAVDAINSPAFRNPAVSPADPSGGIYICFASGSTNQSGLVTIGSNKRTLAVTLKIYRGNLTCT